MALVRILKEEGQRTLLWKHGSGRLEEVGLDKHGRNRKHGRPLKDYCNCQVRNNESSVSRMVGMGRKEGFECVLELEMVEFCHRLDAEMSGKLKKVQQCCLNLRKPLKAQGMENWYYIFRLLSTTSNLGGKLPQGIFRIQLLLIIFSSITLDQAAVLFCLDYYNAF